MVVAGMMDQTGMTDPTNRGEYANTAQHHLVHLQRPLVGPGILGRRHHLLHPHRHHPLGDRKSTRLNSSHVAISYAVFCLKKKNTTQTERKITIVFVL